MQPIYMYLKMNVLSNLADDTVVIAGEPMKERIQAAL